MRSTPPQHDVLAVLPHLRRYAAVLTSDAREADRLVTETLERAGEASLSQAGRAELQTRLFSLMHELHGRLGASQRGPAPVDAAAGAGSTTEDASGLVSRFRKLPGEEREILLLVAVERMRYDEIATILGVPVSTVIARLKHARDLMRGADIGSEQNKQLGN